MVVTLAKTSNRAKSDQKQNERKVPRVTYDVSENTLGVAGTTVDDVVLLAMNRMVS